MSAVLSFISLIRRLLRRRPRPREGAPLPDGPPHAYEGRCQFCRRDIGAGHLPNCPYFEPRLRYGDLLWTGHSLLTLALRQADGRYNVFDLELTPRAARAPLSWN